MILLRFKLIGKTDYYYQLTYSPYLYILLILMFYLENFEPIIAPKTLREIEEENLNAKRNEIILKNQDEVLRKRLIKYGKVGIVFGFIIKMISDDPINQNRNFMLKYYLDDKEFAVYEYSEINSG